MIRKLKFTLRQKLKMLLQNVILPCVYRFWRLVYARREMDLIILADAHHDAIPESMVVLRDRLLEKGYTLTEQIHNFAKMSVLKSTWISVKFMRLYARARIVFICDNFLPVASCKKSEKTKVVQLWHACGLVKKMGYDTTEDIPAGYKGAVYRNYDLMTVSAPCCVAPQTKAMRLPEGIIRPLGVSRTDVYFDERWLDTCRREFFLRHPEAAGKKIILWAPTFRGSATDPYQVGMDAIEALEKQLGSDYYVIRKVHPHVDDRYHLSNCDIITERLLPVTDLLITDYSTVLTEFMFFDKPSVLYVPDLEEYERKRGFYVAYRSLSPFVVTEAEQLKEMILEALAHPNLKWIEGCRSYHLAACDGKSTDRILEAVGL